VLLAINNLFLFADTTLVPAIDFGAFRVITAATAAAVLILGLIWEAE
jgi:hypothetical protein